MPLLRIVRKSKANEDSSSINFEEKTESGTIDGGETESSDVADSSSDAASSDSVTSSQSSSKQSSKPQWNKPQNSSSKNSKTESSKPQSGTSSKPNTSDTESMQSQGSENVVREDFNEAMDVYEEFIDDYVEFMKKFKENPKDKALYSEYGGYLVEYAKRVKDFKSLDLKNLNQAEIDYYKVVQSRVNEKLREAFPKEQG